VRRHFWTIFSHRRHYKNILLHLQVLRYPYLYFCTSKTSKLSIKMSSTLNLLGGGVTTGVLQFLQMHIFPGELALHVWLLHLLHVSRHKFAVDSNLRCIIQHLLLKIRCGYLRRSGSRQRWSASSTSSFKQLRKLLFYSKQ
jgi:hypothetical protein